MNNKKKNFLGGLNSLIGESGQQTNLRKEEKTKAPAREITKSSQKGTKENETRATFIVREDLLEKINRIHYWDRILIKDLINQIFEKAIIEYEKKNGVIKPIPKQSKSNM
jgi:hypothetical protein